MNINVFDLEADGLEPTKIYCVVVGSLFEGVWVQKTLTCYDEMREFFLNAEALVGHNIMRWDIPVVERLLKIKIKAKIIDTLILSWYLTPHKIKHGLGEWGVEFGIPKPVIDDWENQTLEEYIHRCREDVKINCKLWSDQKRGLTSLYKDKKEAWRLIDYLMFKMDCAREAESSKWKLDVVRCTVALDELEAEKKDKIKELREAMPKIPVTKKISYPKKPYKADGSLSATGKKWFDVLKELGYQDTFRGSIDYITSYKEPNPNSTSQVKKWLFSLGWKPETFKYSNEIGERGRVVTKKLEQVRMDYKGERVLCNSVKKLFSVEPALKALEGLTVLSHRIGILKAYLKNADDEGYLQAKIAGITNTLRFKHSVIVNLPSVSKPYGDVVRGVLIAPEGYELCGSDMSSLEDRTKQHYMWDYDPDYVREMQVEDFDPHLALAEFAGALTPEQVEEHKKGEKDYSAIRHLYKTANYSCTYGAGGAKLALTLDIPKQEGVDIVNAYREKNWAINAISDSVVTKKCMGSLWLYNPVSRFWYSLRNEKDKFSTLNQGTGVYCFDMWIYFFRQRRPQITGQMHDEVILCIKKGHREACEKLLKDSIKKVNKHLKLNRSLDVDVQFGDNYASIH